MLTTGLKRDRIRESEIENERNSVREREGTSEREKEIERLTLSRVE